MTSLPPEEELWHAPAPTPETPEEAAAWAERERLRALTHTAPPPIEPEDEAE